MHVRIFHGEKQYVAECLDLPVVTQAPTLDELAANIKEAIGLHLEGENLAELGWKPPPNAEAESSIRSGFAAHSERVRIRVCCATRKSREVQRTLPDGSHQSLTVPLHSEVDRGTVMAIYRQALRFIPEDLLRPRFYTE